MVLVTHYFSAHGGGVESVADRLARDLASNQHAQIAWIASDTDACTQFPEAGVACFGVPAWNGAERYLQIPFPLWGWRAFARLWSAIRHADLVHVHDCLYVGSLMALAIARWFHVPALVTQHVGAKPYDSRTLRWLLEFLNRTIGRTVLTQVARVIFVSEPVRAYFASFCTFSRPPLLIPNGVDLTIFHALDPEQRVMERKRLGVAVETFVHLFVGRFVDMKGVNELRNLVARFPDDLWIFAGAGPVDPASWGAPNVRVVRGVRDGDLARYYQISDLLMLPSKSESAPLVVLESMACGTPVLVCEDAAKGHPEAAALMFIEATGGGDVAERWARRLTELRKDPALLHSRRSQVAQHARNHCSWRKSVEMYGLLIDDMTSIKEK